MAKQWQAIMVGGHPVEYVLTPGLISVRNTSGEVAGFLRGSVRATAAEICDTLARAYQEQLGRPLDVAGRSLAIELWLHAVVDSAARVLRRLPGASAVAAMVVARTAIIEMGESWLDPNRFVWDWLARLLPWW